MIASRKRLFWACFFYGLFFALTASQAQDPRVFVGTSFPLILETDEEDKRPHGVAVDILDKIAEMTGERFDIRVLPWTRAMAMARKGHVSGVIGPYKSKERSAFLNFSTSHFYEDRMIFLQKRHFPAFWSGDFDALRTVRILTVKTWAYGPQFDRSRYFLDIVETVDPKNALKILNSERVELLAYNERNAKADIVRGGLEKEIVICEPAFAKAHGYFAFPKEKGDDDFEARFNEALLKLQASGEIKKINAKYGLGFENE